MVRYAGDRATSGIPIQREAAAYFGRMTTAPSKTFKIAVNQAIYEWKAQGNWAALKGLWLFCADTSQAALLSAIGDTPRDATLTGAPTFAALKGFSGFAGATNRLTLPITSTILADDAFTTVFAGNVAFPGVDDMLIDNATDGTIASWGNLKVSGGGVLFMGGTGVSGAVTGAQSVVIGRRQGFCMTAGGIADRGGSSTTRGSNYRTVSDYGGLARLAAYGFLGSARSARQAQSFLVTLTALINTLGALD